MIYTGKINLPQKQIACTLDAKICPDGTSVGRSGPKCEFASCPTSSIETADWKTYTNTKYGYSIKYPSSWSEEVKCEGGISEDDYICFKSPDFEESAGGFVMGSTIKGGVLWIDGMGDLAGHMVSDFCNSTDIIRYSDCKEISFGGLKGMSRRWVYTSQVGIPDSNNEKFILSFRVSYNKDSEKDILKTFDQILSTFKFTQ